MIAKMQLLFNAKLPNAMNIERKQYKGQLVLEKYQHHLFCLATVL